MAKNSRWFTANQFCQDYGETEIVIASRMRDYEKLNYRLDLQNAIYLQPLTREQINHYFDSLGSQIATVINLWQEDEILQELAKSPLMLNIMTLAYQGLKSEDLPIIDSIEGRRQHLFDKYIQRMFERRRGFKKERYKKEDSMRWLIWLAKRMSFEKETVFLVERMQPSWLLYKIQKWIYRIAFVLLIGIITALVDFFFSNFTLIFINLQLSPNSLTVSFYYYFFYGLFFGIINLIIGKFRRKEEIIPFETIGVYSNNIKMSFTNGSKNGVIPGIIGLIIFLLYNLPNIILYSGINLSYFILFVFFIWTFIGFISFLIMHLFLKKILYNRMYGNIFILTAFIFTSLICTLVMQLSPFILIVSWLVAGAICGGLINVIIWGFRVKNLNVTTSVNQGIWNSGITAVLFLVIGGLIGWYIAGMNSGLNPEEVVMTDDIETYNKTYKTSMLLHQIATIQQFGVIFALIPGIPVIKHITLRVILYFKKYIPWNYARFLDCATERIFLQKVGGGYIFIHRLLQEHFASLKLD